MSENIRHAASGTDGSFIYEKDGKQVGEMHYNVADEHKIIIDHTEVDEAEEGHGIGKKLLGELVSFVRSKQIKVVPQCTFAHATLKRSKDWQDVLFTEPG